MRKYGADAFQRLLNTSQDQAAYQLSSIGRKHEVKDDQGKVSFLQEAAGFLAGLSSPVEREVYTVRAAEMAGIPPEAMKQEVEGARKRRLRKQERQQEKKDLRPAQAVQPTASGLKYQDVRSAVAEEGLLGQIFLENSLMELTKGLKPEEFSAPLLGRVFGWMGEQWRQGKSISVPALEGSFSPEELGHIAGIARKMEGVVNERAVEDYIHVIHNQAAKRESKDLMAARNRRLDKNGYGG